MKRRKFVLSSGTALLGSTAFQSISQQPSVALNFDLVSVENVQPSSVDSILVDFQKFELVSKYVDENSGDATVTITLDIEGQDPIQNKANISLSNGDVVNKSDLGSAIPIVIDEIDTGKSVLESSIEISIDHPDISDTYKQDFTITDDKLLNGLIGYWPLHEWSGDANDLSGKGNNGTINGATQGVWGRGGLTSYSFDGSNHNIDIGSSFEFNGSLTISAWVYKENTSTGNILSNRRTDPDEWIFLRVNGDKTVTFSLRDSNGNVGETSTSSNISLNEWTHILVTAKENGKLKIYIDGSFESESDTIASTTTFANSFKIGSQGGNDDYWNGMISDFRWYNRVLSSEEIDSIYSIGRGDRTKRSLHDGSDPGAVSRYTFDNDLKVNSWQGNTLEDNTSASTTDDSIRQQAKDFNGSGDYMKSSNSYTFDEFTLSYWINGDVKGSNQPSWARHITFASSNPTEFLYNDSGPIYVHLRDNNGNSETVYATDYDPPADVWYNIVFTYNKDGYARSYLNGVKQGHSDISSTLGSISVDSVEIGGDSSAGKYIDGQIDDVRIYSRELDVSEVQNLYQWGTRGKDLRKRTTTTNKNDLLGWWKMNETNGSTAYDSSGNDNDGTINGATPGGSTNTALNQSSYYFDGNDDRADTEDLVSSGDSRTYTAWVYPAEDTRDQHIVGRNVATGTTDFYIEFQSSNEFVLEVWDGGSIKKLMSGTSYQPNNWYHVAATHNKDNLNQLYVNGIKKSQKTHEPDTVTGVIPIGATSNDARPWKGSISDVRIYNRALTPQEISYLYEQKY